MKLLYCVNTMLRRTETPAYAIVNGCAVRLAAVSAVGPVIDFNAGLPAKPKRGFVVIVDGMSFQLYTEKAEAPGEAEPDEPMAFAQTQHDAFLQAVLKVQQVEPLVVENAVAAEKTKPDGPREVRVVRSCNGVGWYAIEYGDKSDGNRLTNTFNSHEEARECVAAQGGWKAVEVGVRRDTLAYLCQGPGKDGNMPSKTARDGLVDDGLVVHMDGWNFLTPNGVRYCRMLTLLVD